MAYIKGFKGVRYSEKAGKIDDLVCPPYDAISETRRQECISRSDYNIVRLELPVGEDKYQKAGELYRQWLDNGILKQDEKDSMYVYEQSFTVGAVAHSVKGIVCAVHLEDFDKRIILPHERTLSVAKNDRFELINTAKASFSQIYSMYIDEEHTTAARIAAASEGVPDVELTDEDGVTHRMWCVIDPAAIAGFAADFENRQLYIADGHHRYETALNYRKKLQIENPDFGPDNPANFTSMFLVDMESDGLVVFPTHRMLRNLGSFNLRTALDAMNKNFSFEKRFDLDNIEKVLSLSESAHSFAFYAGGDSYYLLGFDDPDVVKKQLIDMSMAYCGLDVTILHTLILEDIFDISKADLAKQTKLTYTRSIEEAVTGVKNGGYECCFLLNPTKVSQVKEVAKAGEKMPQKSTYFYPKLITGLVFINLS